MKRIIGILTSAILLSLTSVTFAQQVQPPPEGAPPLPPPGADFVFVASESFGGKIVKGAPYSGEAVTESIQTLADGNRIVNRITSSIYRDSEGRTRREQTLKGLGVLGNGEEPLRTIFINDPVGGVSFSLDSRSHIARKSVPFRFEFLSKPGAPAAEGQKFEFRVGPGDGEQFALKTEAGVPASTYVFKQMSLNSNEVKEQLGKQIIEGVEAEGTRTTVTIPAGEIGNERPIEIVSERWYSPELQLVVMTRHSDPRMGETTYKLTNISRAEPPKSLFEVPAGYTVKEGPLTPSLAPLQRTKKTNPE
jgi:hypothetical protein